MCLMGGGAFCFRSKVVISCRARKTASGLPSLPMLPRGAPRFSKPQKSGIFHLAKTSDKRRASPSVVLCTFHFGGTGTEVCVCRGVKTATIDLGIEVHTAGTRHSTSVCRCVQLRALALLKLQPARHQVATAASRRRHTARSPSPRARAAPRRARRA